ASRASSSAAFVPARAMARTKRSRVSWSAPSSSLNARFAARALARTSARPARSVSRGVIGAPPPGPRGSALRAGQDREDALGLLVRARDDVHGDDLARLLRGDGARVGG